MAIAAPDIPATSNIIPTNFIVKSSGKMELRAYGSNSTASRRKKFAAARNHGKNLVSIGCALRPGQYYTYPISAKRLGFIDKYVSGIYETLRNNSELWDVSGTPLGSLAHRELTLAGDLRN